MIHNEGSGTELCQMLYISQQLFGLHLAAPHLLLPPQPLLFLTSLKNTRTHIREKRNLLCREALPLDEHKDYIFTAALTA